MAFSLLVLFDMMAYADWERYPIMTYLPAALLMTSYWAVDSHGYVKKLVEERKRTEIVINSFAIFILISVLTLQTIQGLTLEVRTLTHYAPYDKIADLILTDPRTRIEALTDLYPVDFYIIIKDPDRRVAHKTLFKFGIEDFSQYIQSIGFPDYIVVSSSYRLFDQSREVLSKYYRLIGEFQMKSYASSKKIIVFEKKAG